jgi:hypothetical protein
MSGFDLSVGNAIHEKQEGGLPLDILDPRTGDPTGWVVMVRSAESSKVLPVARRALLAGAKTLRSDKSTRDDSDALAELSYAKTAVMIAGWDGLTDGGKPVPYTPEMADKLVRQWPWLREQIEVFGDVRENFTKA